MRTQYLTKRHRSYVFQLRPPKTCLPKLSGSPIRITLGPIAYKLARRRAIALAETARALFESMRMSGNDGDDADIDLVKHMHTALHMLAALDGVADGNVDPDIKAKVNDEVLGGMVTLGHDLDQGQSALASLHAKALADHYLHFQNDDAAARRHLRLPAKPAPIAADTKMLDIDKKLDLLLKASVEGQERAEPKSKAPLFSDAADAYIETLRKTHGSSHDELGYLLHRKTIFIAIVGDLRVDQIRKIELQDFVDEIAHISPNFSRQLDYDASEVKAHIKANKDAGGRGLSQKTILDTYLSRIKTIVRFGLEQAGLSYHLTGTRLTIPKTAQPPKRRESADPKDFDAALKYSFAENRHADALLLAMGHLTGRRLAALVFLRCEDFSTRDGVWRFTPKTHILLNGVWTASPIKTTNSADECILHEIFDQIGLPTWVQAKRGFLFSRYHQAMHADNAAQKRMDYVLRQISDSPLETKRGKYGPESIQEIRPKAFTFHGLRHTYINHLRASGIEARVRMMQVGHALDSEHDRYGELQSNERKALSTVPLPIGIDWTVLSKIDFHQM